MSAEITLDEWRKKAHRRNLRIALTAKKHLKPGDKVRVAKCPGGKRTIIFERFDGIWIVSKSGIRDFHPACVDRVNGESVSFGKSLEMPEHLKIVPTSSPLPSPVHRYIRPALRKWLSSKGYIETYLNQVSDDWLTAMRYVLDELEHFRDQAKAARRRAKIFKKRGKLASWKRMNVCARTWELAAARLATFDDIPF